jgi:hypothetical protein
MCIHVFCYKFLKILFNYMINTLCILPLKIVIFTVSYRIKIRGYKNQVTLITGAVSTVWSCVVTSSITVGG